MEFSAQQIVGFLNGAIGGDPNVKVSNFSKTEEGKPGTLTFSANLKYTYHVYNTEVSVALVNNNFKPEQSIRTTFVKVENAYAAPAMLLNLVEQSRSEKKGVDSTTFIAASAIVSGDCCVGNFAYIGEDVRMGENCMVYPHAYTDDHMTVGDNRAFYPHTTVYGNCIIGNNCVLRTGSIVGADDFGFAPGGGTYKEIPQLGNVIIEDDVEIGANITIDRAVMDSTIIHRGVKLDNLVQIAHNVEVGENTVMTAQVGIAGSVKIGKRCTFGGRIGLARYIHVADHVVFGAQAGVISDVKEATTLLGAPVTSAKNFMRSSTIFSRLPDTYRSLGQMQREIEQLKKEINKQ